MDKPKILIAINGFLPGSKFGGTVTSRTSLIQRLEKYFDFSIITLNHDYRDDTPYDSITEGWNFYKGHRILYLSDREHNYSHLLQILKEERPDLIYLSGTITTYFQYNYPLIKAAHVTRIPVLVTPDGDMRLQALRQKWYKKVTAILLCRILNAFKGCHFQTTIDEETKNLQRFLGISADRISFLPNLPHTFVGRKNYFKQDRQLKLIFSARIHPQKNLLFALQVLQKVKGRVQFDIYGPIENVEYWKKCQQIITTCPGNLQISYKGPLAPDQAQRIYTNYDCSFLPTISENYGYSIEESLTCGCPVLISKGTTPWDDLNGKAGFAIPLSQPDLFTAHIERLIEMTSAQFQDFTRAIEEYLTKKLVCSTLIAQYKTTFRQLIHHDTRTY